MRTIKKTVACLVAVLMVLSACSAAFTAMAATSGVCGDNATWSIANGVLAINGEGAIYDYEPGGDNAPWRGEYYRIIAVASGITRIGEYAFASSTDATIATLPDTLTSIGTGAFYNCGLTTVTIPGGVTSWSESFVMCQSLRSVEILSGVTTIDTMAFGGCSALEHVTIPETVTSIGQAAFQMCGLTSINLPDNLVSIGASAFASTGLTEIEIPDTVTTIGSEAFAGSLLVRTTLPPQITTVSEGLFNGCCDLVHVSIPEGATEIGSAAFANCTSLTRIHIPASVQTIASDAFAYSDSLNLICSTVDNGAARQFAEANYISFDVCGGHANPCGDFVTWSFDNGVLTISGVGAMYDYGFESIDCAPWTDISSSITDIVVDPGVTSIGDYAFNGCYSVASVTIPYSVSAIGSCAFSGCDLNNAVYITDLAAWCRIDFENPSSNPLRGSLYLNGTQVTDLVVPATISCIKDYAFYEGYNLTSVTLPAGLTAIGESAFYGCSGVTSVSIPASVTSIGTFAFDYCISLNEVLYNAADAADLTANDNAFASAGSWNWNAPGYSNLTVTFGETVQRIPAHLFDTLAPLENDNWAPMIETVNIGSGVTSIGQAAFKGCLTITDVYYNGTRAEWDELTIGSDNNPLLSATLHCTDDSLTPSNACGDNLTWSIENNVLTISGTGDMYDYYNPYAENPQTPPWMNEYYTEVVIGSGVTSIGSDAFVNSSNLTTVTIPNTVTSIGDEAFTICESLLSVNIPNSVETIGERAFLQCTNLSTLTLGSGLTEIKIGAFGACSSLSSVVIPDSVEIIGVSAFDGCCGLTSLTIGSGVTSIGATAFACCEALTEINYNVPNLADLTNEDGLFACEPDVNTPVTITFGNNVRHVPAHLFDSAYCPHITTVNFGENLSSVGSYAFNGCDSITVGNYNGTRAEWNAIMIGSNNDPLLSATIHCTDGSLIPANTCGDNLTWSIENGVLTISGTGAMYDFLDYAHNIHEPAWYDESFTSVVIGYGVTSVGNYAFSDCTGLTSVTLSDSVASIGDSAFNNCTALTEITIGSDLASVDSFAFGLCSSLTDVYYAGTQQQWNAINISIENNDPLFAATIHCVDPLDLQSVTVDDQVALNLMLDLDARGAVPSDVSITLNGETIVVQCLADGDGQYRFTIIMPPAQISDPIVVTIGGETVATTSVLSYCLELCSPQYSSYEEAQKLARAILQYGKAANDIFEYTETNIPTDGALDKTAVAAYTGAIFVDGTGKVSGASFMALAKPEFRFFMESVTEEDAIAYNAAGVSAAYTDNSISEDLVARFVKNEDDQILLEVTGVSAENLNAEIVVRINALDKTITFNGNAFAKAMANSSNPALQNFGAALYNYGVAAHEAFTG